MISFRTKNRTKHQPRSLIQGTRHEIFDLLIFSTFQQTLWYIFIPSFSYAVTNREVRRRAVLVSTEFSGYFFSLLANISSKTKLFAKFIREQKISWHCPFKNLTRITTHKNILLFTKALRKSPYVVWVRVLVQYVSYKYFRLMSHLLCPPSDMKWFIGLVA